MSEDKPIATRESFGKALAELKDENIVVLDADLSSSTKTNLFQEKYPNRFIENGIAEADSIAYPNLNVKIVGTHSGITVGEDGATHQMLEDINLMRGLPNMTVISPSDDVSTKKLVKEIAKFDGPVYLRVSRMKTPIIYTDDTEFKIGKGIEIGEGTDGTIFATGDILAEVLKAQELLKEDDIDIRVVDMYSIKPIDRKLIVKCAQETGILFSVEDHNIIGGLGSAVAEVLCDECPKKLHRIGISDTFGKSGTEKDLLKYYKLDAESIYEFVKSKFIA